MQSKIARLLGAVGIFALAGGVPGGGALSADELEPFSTNSLLPPQTLPRGFESTGELLRDQEAAGKAPLYSAWLVESSRFVDVAPGSFMPDRAFIPGSTDPKHNIPFFDFPANVGIIKGKDGKITLYDSGWKQLAYIYDWNTSCCWWDLPDQMRNIGLDPGAVTRIVIGHGHWDHAGQLDSFPNAVLYDRSAHQHTNRSAAASLRAEPGLRIPPANGRRNRGQDPCWQGQNRRRAIPSRPWPDNPSRFPGPYLGVAAPASTHRGR
jgi:hypothetical protein